MPLFQGVDLQVMSLFQVHIRCINQKVQGCSLIYLTEASIPVLTPLLVAVLLKMMTWIRMTPVKGTLWLFLIEESLILGAGARLHYQFLVLVLLVVGKEVLRILSPDRFPFQLQILWQVLFHTLVGGYLWHKVPDPRVHSWHLNL